MSVSKTHKLHSSFALEQFCTFLTNSPAHVFPKLHSKPYYYLHLLSSSSLSSLLLSLLSSLSSPSLLLSSSSLLLSSLSLLLSLPSLSSLSSSILAIKWESEYGILLACMSLSFALLRSAVACIRGTRKCAREMNSQDLEIGFSKIQLCFH